MIFFKENLVWTRVFFNRTDVIFTIHRLFPEYFMVIVMKQDVFNF